MLTTTEYRNIIETLESFAKNFQEIRKRLDDLECDKQPKTVKIELSAEDYRQLLSTLAYADGAAIRLFDYERSTAITELSKKVKPKEKKDGD